MSKTKIIEDTEKIINGEDQEEEFLKSVMGDDKYQEMMAWLEGDDDEEESEKGGDKDA